MLSLYTHWVPNSIYPEANRVGMLDFDSKRERGRVIYSLVRLVVEGQRDARAGFWWARSAPRDSNHSSR